MHIMKARKIVYRIALMGIWLLMAAAGGSVSPLPADATLMEYTYTSNDFGWYIGNFPSSPAIGKNITVRFIYDGIISMTPIAISHFEMTSGDLHLATPSQSYSCVGDIYNADSSGRPTAWIFEIFPQLPIITGYSLSTQYVGFNHSEELVYYQDATWVGDALAGPIPGSWTVAVAPVPVPSAVLLLGPALLGLMGWRRFQKSIKP